MAHGCLLSLPAVFGFGGEKSAFIHSVLQIRWKPTLGLSCWGGGVSTFHSASCHTFRSGGSLPTIFGRDGGSASLASSSANLSSSSLLKQPGLVFLPAVSVMVLREMKAVTCAPWWSSNIATTVPVDLLLSRSCSAFCTPVWPWSEMSPSACVWNIYVLARNGKTSIVDYWTL